MTRSKISALYKRSDDTGIRCCFCSSFKTPSLRCANALLESEHIDSLFIFSSSAITCTLNLRPERPKVRTQSPFFPVLCIFACSIL